MAVLLTPARAETKLTVIVFPGVQNLPMFSAQAKGFFAKRDLAVDLKIHAELGRAAQRARRRPLPHRAFGGRQRVRAERQGQRRYRGGARRRRQLQPPDGAARDQVARRHQGQDGRGRRVNTAYAFQLYEMLRQKGLNKGDYEVKPVGGTGQRLEAMTKDKTYRGRDDEPAILDPRREGRPQEHRHGGRRRSAPIRARAPSCCARGARRIPTRWSNICRATSRGCAGCSIRRTRPRRWRCWSSG